MDYPHSVTIEDYYDWDFDKRAKVDQWLKNQGIIPEITRSFTITSANSATVQQIEVINGEITQEEKWPHGPRITTRVFRVEGNEFPL